jgi:prepilin-type processing-associated H-X9-DG protein
MARHTNRRGFTLVEAVMVGVVIALILAVTIPWMREREQARQRVNCIVNLQQLGLTLNMYAHASPHGLLPTPKGLKILRDDIYPKYSNDPALLMCPADFKRPDARTPEADKPQWYLDHSSYWYIAHMATNEEEGQAYLEAYRKVIEDGDGNLDTDLVAPGLPSREIPRLYGGSRMDFPDFWYFNSLSETPVLIEHTDQHGPDGGNVLFMDGHVEFIKYPGKFPMTKAFIEGLKSLEKLDVSR